LTHPARSFAAFRHPEYRTFLIGNSLVMMADNIEHVISYWIVFGKFHSPALGGFAVIAHWVPYLLFSVPVGALTDRIDPRRIIQAGVALFMLVSIAWGVLIWFDVLQPWHAAVLLILHGTSGVLWTPPSQVLVHDLVGPQLLPSAIRLNATGRYLGMVGGPAVGAAILAIFGPALGIMVNAAIYLPLMIWLQRSRLRKPHVAGLASGAIRGLSDILATLRSIVGMQVVFAMTLLAGATSFLVGNSYQAQMPGFARDLGQDHADFFYSMLLAADAAGALAGGFILESRSLLAPKVRTTFVLVMLWCCALGGFALVSGSGLPFAYELTLLLLFAAGFLELSFSSMAQTLVQMHAPADVRGRVIGVYVMAGLGLRAFSGVTVGLGGSLVGIHWSLALSTLVLLALTGALLARNGAPRPA